MSSDLPGVNIKSYLVFLQGAEDDFITLSSEDENQPVDETLIEGYVRGVNFKVLYRLIESVVSVLSLLPDILCVNALHVLKCRWMSVVLIAGCICT